MLVLHLARLQDIPLSSACLICLCQDQLHACLRHHSFCKHFEKSSLISDQQRLLTGTIEERGIVRVCRHAAHQTMKALQVDHDSDTHSNLKATCQRVASAELPGPQRTWAAGRATIVSMLACDCTGQALACSRTAIVCMSGHPQRIHKRELLTGKPFRRRKSLKFKRSACHQLVNNWRHCKPIMTLILC